ncbi:MAG: putative spermidine/putrescine transport system permease protein [Rhodospirillaceae bacterium]|jgi:putative spermidine/putrescine transport system permease protein|nr:putative spermidine/putrescine transport system permease protein [Rhodospirillaceae bacterium]
MSATMATEQERRSPGLRFRRRAGTFLLLLPALIFLGSWFILPMGQLLMLSFDSPGGPLASYATLLESEVFRQVFINTLELALVVTALCVVLACPAAYLLSRLRGVWFTLALYCVLVPFWISVLVRSFSWMLLLERNGPVNAGLIWAGFTNSPLPLLFNSFSVYVGMVHVLLPYAVLPTYSAMLKVDPRLLQASEGLGASGLTTFLRVYLPLILPGVLAGATFVFLLALGFYITPALLGGLRNLTAAMLIDNFVNERLIWPLAAAASFILLFMVLAVLGLASRFIALGAALVTR